jgi:hypothetical protein
VQVLVLQSTSPVWSELQSLRNASNCPQQQWETIITDLGLLLEARADAMEARITHAMQSSMQSDALHPHSSGSDGSDNSADATVLIATRGGFLPGLGMGAGNSSTTHASDYPNPAAINGPPPDPATAALMRWRDQEAIARLHGMAAALLAFCVDWGLPAAGRLVLDCWGELGVMHPQQEANFQVGMGGVAFTAGGEFSGRHVAS